MAQLINLDSFSAVGAGETANLVLPVNPRYEQIYLETNVADKIKRVRLTLNAEEIFSLTRQELAMLQSYAGIAQESGFITLPLNFDGALMLDSQIFTGLVTGPGDNPVLEVEIAEDAAAPRLKAFAETSARGPTRDVIRRFQRYTVPVAAEGEVDFNTMVRGPGIKVLRMFFKSDAIDALEIKRDGVVIYEATKKRNDFLLKRAGKTLPEGYFVFDPTRRDFPLRECLSTTAHNLNFKLKTKGVEGAKNIDVLVEQLASAGTKWS